MWFPARARNEKCVCESLNIFTMNISTLFEYHCHFYVFTLTSYTFNIEQTHKSSDKIEKKMRHNEKQRNRNPGLFTIPVTINKAFRITI